MIDHLLFDNKKWVDEAKLNDSQRQVNDLQNQVNELNSQISSLNDFHKKVMSQNGKGKTWKAYYDRISITLHIDSNGSIDIDCENI